MVTLDDNGGIIEWYDVVSKISRRLWFKHNIHESPKSKSIKMSIIIRFVCLFG